MSFGKFKLVLCAILLACISATQAKAQAQVDVISLDLSNAPPPLAEALLAAEAVWEERLIGYSTELPRAILDQLTTVQITAGLQDFDGVGGFLGFGGPMDVLTLESPRSALSFNDAANPIFFPVTAGMVFDTADAFPATEDAQLLLDALAIHEMGHALGFGTLWQPQGIVGNQNPLSNGLSQYINGQYALAAYRAAINEPFAPFVPVSQPDLGHWDRVPGLDFPDENRQDIMLASASSEENPNPEFILTEITFAAMADLGYAVSGINDQFVAAPGNGTGRWPKVIGAGGNPFGANGVAAGQGLGFRRANFQKGWRLNEETGRPEVVEVTNTNRLDPYNLRNLRWTNK